MAKITSRNMQPEQEKPDPVLKPKCDTGAAREKLEEALNMVGPKSQLNTLIHEAIELL